MDINRDNYEEYFLLYADNELTDSEKAEVLIFVKNNKDLEEEFRTMLLTISQPDTNIQLTDKSFLLKQSESAFINQKNYEEVFVLYHDNELNGEQREQTEAFLLQHPGLKEEFDLIGIARLTPDNAIVFPDKKVLYKKDRRGKVVPLFIRLAVAAALIGFILWMAKLYFQKPAATLVIIKPPSEKIASPKMKSPVKEVSPVKEETKAGESIARNSDQHPVLKEEKHERVLSQKNSGTIVPKNITPNEQPDNSVANNILPERISNKISEGDELSDIPVKNNSLTSITPVVVPIKKINNNSNATNGTLLPVQKTDDNYVFYDVKADNFKKTKVGGFLKRIRRVVERTNPIAQLVSGDSHQVALK